MYIAIEGVIGVGKTTLCRLLQDAFQALLLLEKFEENPFLAKFYEYQARYAFQTQIFFLLSRYRQLSEALPSAVQRGVPVVADYAFAKDSLFAHLNLAGEELAVYHQVHDALAEKLPAPDLIVYLQASTRTLMQRIALRDRSYEREMSVDYIEALNQTYERFYLEHRWSAPVLLVETDHLDYVRNPQDLQLVENRIRQALHLPPFQSSLLPDIGARQEP
ncbi:MAG: deoxynucleoside kinase [Anaerolineales bacterium]